MNSSKSARQVHEKGGINEKKGNDNLDEIVEKCKISKTYC